MTQTAGVIFIFAFVDFVSFVVKKQSKISLKLAPFNSVHMIRKLIQLTGTHQCPSMFIRGWIEFIFTGQSW